MSIVRSMGRVFGGAVALVGLVGLASCGGGGGGSQVFPGISPTGTTATDSNNVTVQSDAFLVGQKNGSTVTYAPYPTNPNNPGLGSNGIPLPVIPGATPFPWGSAAITVAAPTMPTPTAGAQSFVEILFGAPLKASTVKSSIPGTADGIALFYVGGGSPPCQINGAVCTSLDVAGVVDPTNAVANDEAPARLRLYYDVDNSLPGSGGGTSDAFTPGQYVLRINPSLRFADGRFFNNGLTSSGVANGAAAPVMPSWGFSIGADTVLLDTTGPSEGIRVNGITANGASNVALGSEIIINFNDAVDFTTLVGPGSLTSRDPFITQPFALAQFGPDGLPGTADDGGPLNIGNLTINYVLPIDPTTGLPAQVPFDLLGTIPPCGPNLGVIVYQPDPKTNPNQVRIRFCNIGSLVGAEVVATGAFQNYASNPDKYPIRSTNPALINPATNVAPLLTLPPIQPVPGSIATNPITAVATCTVAVAAATQDRAGNQGTAQQATFSWAVGPPRARNPMGVDLLLVGFQSGGPLAVPGIGAVNVATVTAGATPGGALTGAGTLRPASLQNSLIMGAPLDFEVDLPCNPFWLQAGVPWDAPRGTTIPGIPDTAGQLITASIFGTATPLAPVPAPHGTLIWAVDGTSKSLKLFNSFDWSLISTIPGVASPGGLGMSPNFASLYVSNTDQGTLQRVELNPGSPAYGTVTNTVSVGPGPRSVAVTPTNEDVFCLNYAGNSVSIVRVIGVQERLRFSGGLGPADVCITNRMAAPGLTNEFQAFITNEFSNTVDVFESAGGAEFFNLPDGRIVGTGTGFLRPLRCGWNNQTFLGAPLEPGALVVNAAGTTVSEFTMFYFAISPPPGFAGIPYARSFHVLRNFSGGAAAPGATPSDVTIDSMAGSAAPPPASKANVPVPRLLLIAFPSTGSIVAYDYLNSGATIASIAVPGCDILHNFWSQ